MKITMEDKIALVTGAGAGLGKATAKAFGSLGAKVVVAEINPEHCKTLREEFKKDGIDHLVVETDVCSIPQVDALAKQIEQKYGRLDVLVNNVGHHLKLNKRFETSTDEDWSRLYDINLRHMFIVTKAMIPLMKKSGKGGSIINVSSVEGFRSYPGSVPYCAFKHAVTGFTRGLALDLADYQIRVNTVAPETTETEQVPISKSTRPEYFKNAERCIPLSRFGKPEDTAWACVYLANDNAGWITGTEMLVDGGALPGNVFQRTPEGVWTHRPIITGKTTW
jgi:NAD(P)-dependent dehydrogenase (short-subunit alcohol dehydrogenase family)